MSWESNEMAIHNMLSWVSERFSLRNDRLPSTKYPATLVILRGCVTVSRRKSTLSLTPRSTYRWMRWCPTRAALHRWPKLKLKMEKKIVCFGSYAVFGKWLTTYLAGYETAQIHFNVFGVRHREHWHSSLNARQYVRMLRQWMISAKWGQSSCEHISGGGWRLRSLTVVPIRVEAAAIWLPWANSSGDASFCWSPHSTSLDILCWIFGRSEMNVPKWGTKLVLPFHFVQSIRMEIAFKWSGHGIRSQRKSIRSNYMRTECQTKTKQKQIYLYPIYKCVHSQCAVWISRRRTNAPKFAPTYNRANRTTPWCCSTENQIQISRLANGTRKTKCTVSMSIEYYIHSCGTFV